MVEGGSLDLTFSGKGGGTLARLLGWAGRAWCDRHAEIINPACFPPVDACSLTLLIDGIAAIFSEISDVTVIRSTIARSEAWEVNTAAALASWTWWLCCLDSTKTLFYRIQCFWHVGWVLVRWHRVFLY